MALARAPAVAKGGAPIDLPGPYDPALVGFVVSECGELVFALPDAGRIAVVDTLCGDNGPARACGNDAALASVSGLAVSGRRLYVADRAGGAIHVFTLPALELTATWSATGAPARIGVDGVGRIYVLDTEAPQLVRLRADGRVDRRYAGSTAAVLSSGLDLCVSVDGRAFVSVAGQPDILRFESSGAALAAITAPLEGFRPGALASGGGRLYAADRAEGGLWTYDLDGDRWLGPLSDLRAPVTGLAVDGEGHLYMRLGAGAQYVRFEANGAYVLHGEIEAGPLDAGQGNAWMRVHVKAEVPSGTRVCLETALADLPGAAPPLVRQPALDVMVHAPETAGVPVTPVARFLWLRVRLETNDAMTSPRVTAVVAETPGENYLECLPVIYARADEETGAGGGALRASLETLRAELGDLEAEIAGLAARLDPAMAPPDHLPWLASWIAADLPPQASVAARRDLLLDAHRLYERRGTLAGLREMVRLYTGVDCEITESFRERRLWMLDARACLGFDTGLLPALPDGMVVPGPAVLDPALQGLSASYFLDDHFGTSADAPDLGDGHCEPFTAAAPIIDRDGTFPQFAPPPISATPVFSVIWTGQVFARFAEVYTFHFKCDGGARVYVNGERIIDSWITPAVREPRGSLPLTEGRWYSIRIEHWGTLFKATPVLSWSSRSQFKEPIPQEFLYAVDNDTVAPDVGSAPPLIVGDAIVGEQGPLAAEDFGAPLFADAAHHFTVRLRARNARRAGVLDAVRAVLDAEKPAHTDYHLCVVEPTLVVGQQARVGVDAVVPHPPPGGRYDEATLGRDARLGVARVHADTLRVEENLRIGANAVLR